MFDPETGLLPVNVEIQYDGEWHDITDDVEVSDELKITRGRDDYESAAGPSRLSFVLDNTDGKYTPKNPLSPLYGKIGRNTPVRMIAGEPEPALALSPSDYSAAASSVATPDGIDVRVDLELSDWDPEKAMLVMCKADWDSFGYDMSWDLLVRSGGTVSIAYSTDGTLTNRTRFVSTDAVPSDSTRLTIRAVLVPDDGAGNHTCAFYTGPSCDGPWTQLGAPLGGSGTISVATNAIPPSIWKTASGKNLYNDTVQPVGVIHRAQLRNGDGGPVVADVDFSTREIGEQAATFDDPYGNAWTEYGDSRVVDAAGAVRFCGDVIEWPPRWDDPEHAATAVEAAGVRRRIDRNSSPLKSPMFRAVASNEEAYRTAAYWPMEEGDQATEFASGIGGPPMPRGGISGYHDGDTQPASYSGFLCSGPLPEFHSRSVSGAVPLQPETGELRILAAFHLPPAGITGESRIFGVRTSGSCAEWTLIANADGALAVRGKDRQGNEILTSGWGGFDANGDDRLVSLWLTQNGSDIDWQVYTFAQATQIGGAFGDTLAGRTLGSAVSVAVGPRSGEDLGGTAIGHVTVLNRDTDYVGSRILDGFTAYSGELAANRVGRLAAEEDIPLVIGPSPDESEPMGLQTAQSLSDLFDEAAESDLGILQERRDSLALEYRPRWSLYNQKYVTLDYEAGHIVPPFEPTDDDTDTRNDVTVNRKGGASFRATRTDGPLAIDAIGRYDHSVDLSLKEDPQAAHQAGWRLHLGTLDDLRYPRVHVSLHGSPELIESVRRLDVGDRLKITNLPKWLPPDTADLIVQGYEETFDGLRWDIVFNCTPAFSWQVGVADDTTYGRADTSGSELLSPVDAAATDLQVLTTDGPRWVEDPAEFPFDVKVGGEHVTVTAVQPLLSDDFTRPGDGVWGQSLWGSTFIWSA